MCVYVDRPAHHFSRMLMCHMIADSTKELLQMADQIGVARRWIQKAGTAHEHFDIGLSKRHLAIQSGAIEIRNSHLASILRGRLIEILKSRPEGKLRPGLDGLAGLKRL